MTSRQGKKWGVRIRIDGKLRRFGLYESAAAASAAEETIRARLIERGTVANNITVAAYGFAVIDRRERRGLRNTRTDRIHWHNHVEDDAIGSASVQHLTPRDVREWRDRLMRKRAMKGHGHKRAPKRTLSRSVVNACVNLLRVVMREAQEDGFRHDNPAKDVRLPRARHTVDGWTYLHLGEQRALLSVVPAPYCWVIALAIGTGLRSTELRRLEWDDVSEREILVRHGKGGKIRRIPIFGLTRQALDNLHRDGIRVVPVGVPPKSWRVWLDQAGITRRVRWHDLRHTCGASLVSGLWGRRWSLEEVRALLGHSTITITERYAHLAPTLLSNAADEHGSVPHMFHPDLKNAAPPGRFERPTNGLGSLSDPFANRSVAGELVPQVERRAKGWLNSAVLALLSRGTVQLAAEY